MCHVLVIDDDKMVLEMLSLALTHFGHTVETAALGEEGLRIFDDDSFDCIITDIRMPDMDGHGVAQRIRDSDRPWTPIIAISGTEWLVNEHNFDSVFAKPFDINELLDTIHRLTLDHLEPKRAAAESVGSRH